eukprot:SAG31_NODE_2671_length_5270_cov_5.903114_5_plen_127_part_00
MLSLSANHLKTKVETKPTQGANVSAPLAIQVFSDLPFVELFLNDVSLGVSAMADAPQSCAHGICASGGFANFHLGTGWQAGNLTAVGMSDAVTHTPHVHTIVTAGPAASIVLSLDAPVQTNSPHDI